MYTNIGPVQLVACPWETDAPVEGAIGRVVLRDLYITGTLAQLQDHVERLTLGIPNVRIDELPMRLQRHTTGVPSHWTRLLLMITQAVTCYHQHT